MSGSFLTLAQQLSYLYSHLTVAQALDITLVMLVFFVAFQALYQTRALQLLRGAIIAGLLGGGLVILMPLATLGWLVRIALVAGAIALPILFQDELRRALVGLGQFGERRSYSSDYSRFKRTLIIALNRIATRSEGALIVLEGQTHLEDIIATGIPMRASVVTPELLETIFFPNTPLHDGAVVLRGDRLAAASCVLPVQTESTGERHLGMRHRAALGLSNIAPDALVLVVSEETGHYSVAWGGKLYFNLSQGELEGWLDRFGAQPVEPIPRRWRWLRGGGLRASLVNLLTALLLAIIAWLVVIYQTNPPGQVIVQGVTLAVSSPPPGTLLMSQLPASVSVELQSTRDRIAAFSSSSLHAELNLEALTPGLHSVPVHVSVADPFTQVLSVSPKSVDLNIEQELTREITPTVMVLDLNQLPTGYVVGEPQLAPQRLAISGPSSLVGRVAAARVDLTIGERRADFQDSLRPVLLDSSGKPVAGLQVSPEQVVVTVSIRRTSFTRQVGIQPSLSESELDPNYEIRSLKVTPTSVTLTGPQAALDNAGDYLVTAPISLTGHFSDFIIDAPLIVPGGLTAVDDQGKLVQSVQVEIGIAPVTGYLVLNLEPDFTNLAAGLQANATPGRVSVLLIGPQTLLNEVSKQPGTVRLQVDLTGLIAGGYTLQVTAQAPSGIEVQLFPKEVQVVIK